MTKRLSSALLGLAMTAASLAHAAAVAKVEPVSKAIIGVQGFLHTSAGDRLIAREPSLLSTLSLDPKEPAHLQAFSAAAQAVNETPGLLKALANPDRRESAGETLLRIHRGAGNRRAMGAALEAELERVEEGPKPTGEAARKTALALFPLRQFATATGAAAAARAEALAEALVPESMRPPRGTHWIGVLEPRPTQFDVGVIAATRKQRMFEAMTAAERRAYMLQHPLPVVIREDGERRVHKGGASSRKNFEERRPNDHHHELWGAYHAGVERIAESVELEDRSKGRKFWKRMKKGNKVYLLDRWGEAHDPSDLPSDVRGLGDNPYRSIAAEVRDRGGYEKNRTPFSEFLWAQYFRENLTIRPNDDYEGAVEEAMLLARKKRAKALPGWIGKPKG